MSEETIWEEGDDVIITNADNYQHPEDTPFHGTILSVWKSSFLVVSSITGKEYELYEGQFKREE